MMIAFAGLLIGGFISYFSAARKFGESVGFALFPGGYCIYSTYSKEDPPLIVDGCREPHWRRPGTYYPVIKVTVWFPAFISRPDDCYQCILEYSFRLSFTGALLFMVSGAAIIVLLRRRWPDAFNF